MKGKPFPNLLDVTTQDLTFGLKSGLFSSVDLVKAVKYVQAYIARIEEVNPILNVITELNPDALGIAANLDAERKNGTTRGPLHGVPIIIKNNIATMDRMNNTAGSFALLGAKVPRDSGVAAKLRAAGVIILGKSNMSQWTNLRSLNSTNGWSAYGGQVYAAYYPQQDPSGSSSGSGVASSIGLALAALGTETRGSILLPSGANNLVGIKPTVGLTSRSLVIPVSERQDTVGPMARTVKDAAYVLQAIAGKDDNDKYTIAIPFDVLPDYVAACNFSSLRGKRIGIPRNLITSADGDEPILSAFETALGVIKSAGATIVDNTNVTDYALDQYLNGNSSFLVVAADLVSNLPKNYLSKLESNPKKVYNLTDINNFIHHYPLEDYPDRDTALFDRLLAVGSNNTSQEFLDAYQTNLAIAGPQGILGLLANFSLDALILPTAYSPGLPALAGLPVVTVPLGFFPYNTTVVRNERKTLVEVGPNIPYVLLP
ncbi:hypothetical protein MMC22_011717 [Lobaria immixta]|nr:hypothetical protein [Lobaria immixta]